MTKKASYITLGCKLNYAETSTYERNFMKEGYESVPWTEKADLYVINTCSVTEHADRKSRNIIRKIHRTAPEATVVVTGCYAQLKRAEVEALEGRASRTSLPSWAAYCGSRSGPSTTAATTSSTMNSLPLMPNTASP